MGNTIYTLAGLGIVVFIAWQFKKQRDDMKAIEELANKNK